MTPTSTPSSGIDKQGPPPALPRGCKSPVLPQSIISEDASRIRSEIPFTPAWAVKEDDTALGEPRVARELALRGRLRRDRVYMAGMTPSELCSAAYTAAAQGSSFISRLTRLCKGLVVGLVGGYAIIQTLPPAVTYLALILARTIPFGWNLITAGYIEQSVFGVVVSAVGLLSLGKVLEPIWGSCEFLKFIFVVNFLTYFCVFVTTIALYYTTRQELYLYTPLSGFHGVLSGFLVGIKQIVSDQELFSFSVLKVKAKWVPSLVILMSIAISFFTAESASYLPTLVFGTYTSWIYLRYLQRKPETNRRGDPSEEPVVDPIASVLDWMLCGRSRTSGEAKEYTLNSIPLPSSDPIEATRRRERGARALEERLAAEKLAVGGSTDNLPSRDAAENV